MVRDRGHRRQRRDALKMFQEGFDFSRLDYRQRLRPLRGKALLTGVIVAGLLYSAGFAIGYFGWQHQAVSYELFARLVWVLMVPATAAGGFAWLLHSNRLEYTLRDDIRRYIRQREGDRGWLWCFAPLQEAVAPTDFNARKVMQQSRQGSEQLDPEDYASTVYGLYLHLQQDEHRKISADTAGRVLDNIGSLGRR